VTTVDAHVETAGRSEHGRGPSRWQHRLPLALAAFGGFLVATYLTLYQLRVVGGVWEPFFGDGSRRILNSSVARFLPVPDASLGAAAYLAEVVLCLVGGTERWRRWPRLVLLYGAVVAAMGVGSVVLMILQGTVFHAWCTLCLLSAFISIGIVVSGLREPLASLRKLRRSADGARHQDPSSGDRPRTRAHGGYD